MMLKYLRAVIVITGLVILELSLVRPAGANDLQPENQGKALSAGPPPSAWTLSSGVEQGTSPIHYTDLVCPSVTTCYAGAIDRVIKTKDSGKTFTTLFQAPTEEIKYPKAKSVLWFSDSLTGYAAIAGNDYFGIKTKDGGRTWTRMKSPALAGRFGFFDEKHGVSGTPSGLMFSTDGGAAWKEASVENSEDLKRFYSKPALIINKDHTTEGLIVSFDPDSGKSSLLKTTDMGKSWKKITPVGHSDIRSVFFIDQDHAWIGTVKGMILKTTDAGKSWKEVFVSSAEVRQITCTGRLTCFALSGIMIYRTNDGGTTWTMLQPFDITKPVYPEAIGFTNGELGIAAGFYIDPASSKEMTYVAFTTTGGILKNREKNEK